MISHCILTKSKKIVSLWFKITFTGCQFWIPLGLISFIYAKLCFRIWNNQVPGNPHNDRDYHLWFQKKKSVKMMISVVAVFGLCWLPWHTFYIIKLIWPSIAEWVKCDFAIEVVHKLLPCPFTGRKMFWVGPNFLSQP